MGGVTRILSTARRKKFLTQMLFSNILYVQNKGSVWDIDFICNNWTLWVLAQGIVQQQKGSAKWRGMMTKKRL